MEAGPANVVVAASTLTRRARCSLAIGSDRKGRPPGSLRNRRRLSEPPAQRPWGGNRQSLAAPRKARVGLKVFLRVERFFSVPGLDPSARTVRQHLEALLIVEKICFHNLIEDVLMNSGVKERHQSFDSAIQIALHEIRR